MREKRLLEWVQLLVFGGTSIGVILFAVAEGLGWYAISTAHLVTIATGLLALIGLDLCFERKMFLTRLDIAAEGELLRTLGRLPTALRNHVVVCVEYCSSAADLGSRARRSNEGYVSLLWELLEDQRLLLEALANGRLSLPAEEAGRGHRLLMKRYRKRLEAVSDSDLDFWSGSELLAREYLAANGTAIQKHQMVVIRIFIVSLTDVFLHPETLVTVLTAQHRMGVAWGLAIREELDPDVRDERLHRDFAIFDTSRAIVTFRKRDDHRFEAILDTPNNVDVFRRQRHLFTKIVGECWLVNRQFKTRFREGLTVELAQELDQKLNFHNRALETALSRSLGAADPFVVVVEKQEAISGAIRELGEVIRAWRVSRDQAMPAGSV